MSSWLTPTLENIHSTLVVRSRSVMENQTMVTEFLLIGFHNLQSFKIPLFFLFLTLHVGTLAGNLLIIVLVSTSHNLTSPMFFFLSHLSFADMLFTANIVPNMLHIILADVSTISFTGCMVQFYFFGASAIAECLLLSVMSYDRYLAICDPLRYTAIMDSKLRLQLVIWTWLLSFMVTLITVNLICHLEFCGPNIIDHFFCDVGPLLALVCSNGASLVQLEITLFSFPLILSPLVFIIGTYTCIFLTILRISSSIGKQKAFSTCSSHLAVVCTYYGTLFTVYVVPSRGHSLNINKVLSLLYTVVTPLFNPIIYSLRNQEIRAVIDKYIGR
ncbi:hypothetical protein FKM82_007378, partial [Ascaphus truei]